MINNVVRCKAACEADIQDVIDRLAKPGVYEEYNVVIRSTNGVLGADFTNTVHRRYDK